MRDKDQILLENLYKKILLNENIDEEYLRLAQNPEENIELLLKMVDNAAKSAGYIYGIAQRGDETKKNFRINDSTEKSIYFLIGAPKMASRYAHMQYAMRKKRGDIPHITNAYLKIEKPYFGERTISFIKLKDMGYDAWIGEKDKDSIKQSSKFLQKPMSSDDTFLNPEEGLNGTELAVFNENQVKLADPITYDDKGNIIPLSQRFDSSKNDIRY